MAKMFLEGGTFQTLVSSTFMEWRVNVFVPWKKVSLVLMDVAKNIHSLNFFP